MSTIKTKTSSFEIGACVTLSKFEELCREFFSPFWIQLLGLVLHRLEQPQQLEGILGHRALLVT